MPVPSSVPWGSRLRDVFGAPLQEIGVGHIEALVKDAVREAADLDFKQALYGKGDPNKQELCKDIAAMRNDRGGVIVLGVKDRDGVAVDSPGVALSEGEERRMLQIVAAGTAPHAAFQIQRIDGATKGHGYYLLVAPPSPYRPHGVIVDEGFRYPRRDGPTTRYLSEVEVSDLYRSRFFGESDQRERLERVAHGASNAIDHSQGAWLVLAAVPNDAGALPMSFTERTALEEWLREPAQRNDPLGSFRESAAVVGVAGRCYTVTHVGDYASAARWEYAECHADGAVSTAYWVAAAEDGAQPALVAADRLVWLVLKSLRLVGLAAQRAGVYGDIAMTAQLGQIPMRLTGNLRNPSLKEQRLVARDITSRHTFPVEALARPSQDMLRCARLLLNDVANAFGSPEIKQLADDGTIRLRYFTDNGMRDLAQLFDLPTTDEYLTE
jgi:hypothetical protein